MIEKKLKDLTFVAFDIETSGAYPLNNEICELAAVKFKDGKIIGEYQTLAKTKVPMSDFIIGIHGITNEMLINEVPIVDKIESFYEFIKDAVCVGHHCPFDMGFISIEFEKKNLLPPSIPALCTSLLSRKLFPESINHKLQTLVEFFNLDKNQAHRALDDAISCLSVMKKCFDKMGWERTLEEALKIQDKNILWSNFYLTTFRRRNPTAAMIEAIEKNKWLRIVMKYGRGKQDEKILPQGFVCSPDGNFLFASNSMETKPRRYYVDKIIEAEVIDSIS